MRHIFKIYPALFILTATQKAATGEIQEVSGSDCRSTPNDDQFRIDAEMENCFLVELLQEQSVVLRPAKFQGKRYVITYIPVLN